MLTTYTLHLTQQEEIADATYAFVFPKPVDFTYTAGQYISLCVDKPEVAMPGGTMRELSLASAPYESELLLALRFRETRAKQQFLNLKVGDPVYMQGPFGQFGLEPKETPAVFLAGGIGIVPFLGMIKQALYENQKRKFIILFSNRRKQDIPFLPELELLSKTNDNVSLINTLTTESPSPSGFEVGYLNQSILTTYVPDVMKASYYVSGPQRFVGGMWEMLESLGISESAIHGEEFTGY